MGREPFQVLVLPFCCGENSLFSYAIFKRRDSGHWQFIAGGGEAGEDAIAAARREAKEEAGIPEESTFYGLESRSTVPVSNFAARRDWPKDLLTIPEIPFGVKIDTTDLRLSEEHTEFRWASYEEAKKLLSWDSNKNALRELDERLKKDTLGPA